MLYLPLLLVLPVVSLRELDAVSAIDSRRDVRHDSCKLRLARQTADPSVEPSMTESFVLDDIEYKLCRYHVTWDEALVFCSSHKAHLATLDTEEKTAFVVQAIASSNSVSEDYWIGARKYYRGSWTWNSNRRKLSFERDLISDTAVSYPGYESRDVHCLTIDRSGHDVPIFIPRDCNQQRPFICQRDNERTVDSKIRMVAASRVGDQEFRLYSGRATWTEAVVQCRQEGLQIGEVKTIAEARALAVLMLRNRPDGIESAWIGGYTRKDDPGTWRWLASGDRIENNGMWRKNLTDSVGGCLLLDRHVCESPVYVSTACDRKRDVLCQKPPKKRFRKYPVAVIVDDCPYWIGFNPLAWAEAKRSCDTVNASLVVLDSPKTIAHMMTLMLENRAELRHIWTDGTRARNTGRWQWNSTGERIPDFGKSFVPWCPEDGYNRDESECLNLDRENLDTPLVYGLSCTEKQPYICQPHTGICVFHSKPTPTSSKEEIPKPATRFTPPFYEDSGPLPISKVTAPYPMPNDNYEAMQTAIDGDDNHLTNLLQWKPDEVVAEKNASTDNLRLSEYLKPLSSFSLPSLPQFGIRVVSAVETTPSTRPIFEVKKKKTKNYPSMILSFNETTSSISASTALPAPTSSRKFPIDAYRKSSLKFPAKSPTNSSVTSNSSVYIEPTISSFPSNGTTANVSSKTPNLSSLKMVHVGSKNSTSNSSTTSAAKIATTSSSLQPEDPSSFSTLEEEKSNKYSVKTTRDLSQPNSTRIATLTLTTKTPDMTNKNKPIYSFRRTGSSLANDKDFKDSQPKPVVVESFPVNAARPNTTLVPRRRPKIRTTTTEATPYDAVDADYYNYDAAEESSTGKTTTEEESSGRESNEYIDDYEPLTKKKTKQTSSSSIRKVHTTPKSFRRMKLPKEEKMTEDNDEVDEEAEENAEDNDRAATPANETSIPIAAELSKNLEAALMNMMKQSVEKKKNGSVDSAVTLKSGGQRQIILGNVSGVERNTKASKTLTNTENWSLRPYYAFEGPMIVGLSEDLNLGGEVERTSDRESGKVREFKFIGKTIDENSMLRKLETDKSIGNETRRQLKSPSDSVGNRRPVGNAPGVPMPGMPVIQPNDPSSLVQLGRYFKNKFAGLESDGRPNVERVASEERKSSIVDARPGPDDRFLSDQRRYGTFGPNSRPRLRYRPRQGARDDELRRGHPVMWEKKRRPFQESDSNYYEGRRLYPRGYDVYGSSMSRQAERRNEDTFRYEQDRLGISWPERNVSDSEFYGYDERSQVVSPRTFPAPIRTTRSFHEDSAVGRAEPSRLEQFPDFRLSKLVKEVKIDLDQRMLRRYLEGFARKISRKDNGREDDWKSTWRQLLGQMLKVLDRMNINVNGDLVKVRLGSDVRDNLEPSSRTLDWKSGPKKHRKDPISAIKDASNQISNRMNASSTDGSHRRVSPNTLDDDDHPGIKNSRLLEERTTDSYRLYPYRQSVTRSPAEDQRKVGRRRPSALPEVDLLRTSKNGRLHEERTARPIDGHQFTPRQVGNGLQRASWYQPKYARFSNSSILPGLLASPPSIIPHLSTVFGYQPVMPQLHHRILFPGWTGIRVVDRISPTAEKSTVLKGEYLPRGTLSRIVGSEHKNEHFGSGVSDRAGKSTTSTPRIENVPTSPRDSFDRKIGSRLENESGTENRNDEGWRRAGEEMGRNDYRNGAPSRFYSGERYPGYQNESDIRKIDDDRADSPEARGLREEDITDEDANPREDNEQKRVWSPAHHLTKALELSLLRKFGTASTNSLRSKNLVARSTKISETESSENRGQDGFAGGRSIEDNFETLNEEPSIVSLRMTMDPLVPEKKSSSRAFRQSHGSRITERKPRTIELRVLFTGKEDTASSATQRIDAANGISSVDRRESPTNRTLRGFSTANQRSILRAARRRSRGFVDKDRRRALMNRLRERNRDFHSGRPRSYPRPGENKTSTTDPRDESASAVLSPRDRKSRTIAVGGKNSVGYENSSKDRPVVRHHIATVVRSFEDEKLMGKERDKWRRGGPYGKEFGVDWSGQAASLFTDLKENSDEFTLYIDLTLGRVGTKTKNRGRPRG